MTFIDNIYFPPGLSRCESCSIYYFSYVLNTSIRCSVNLNNIKGIASVIMSPDEFEQMEPDTILVCPLTTPAWTQLFPYASALVTDIGSITAHGSIVAREFGIPAVLGTGNATRIIKHGQEIEVDGDTGKVTLV